MGVAVLSLCFIGICSRWCFDETVTHFIYQGRQNDSNKEYKSVKEKGIHIVSEHWLLEVWGKMEMLRSGILLHAYSSSEISGKSQ